VIERLDELEASIQRWLEKNMSTSVRNPIEKARTSDPVQAMFCGPIVLMQRVLRPRSCGLPITVVRTSIRAAIFPLSMCLTPAFQGTRARALGQLPPHCPRAGHGHR